MMLTTKRVRKQGVGPRGRTSRVVLLIDAAVYGVTPVVPGDAIERRVFRLHKPDGTVYDVCETSRGPRCDCPDFIFRRDGIDPAGCKHVQALVAGGLIEASVVSNASRPIATSC